ncbi:MAG: hypothetical protein ACE3L7_18570 [Candidatus Pristimantibacillus sp.]
MRIDSSYNRLLSTQRNSGKQESDFLSYMMQEEKKEEKQEENKGKLITAKEGAYVRQYLVRADGSKVLLSETKQGDEDAITDNYQHPAASIQREKNGALSANTEEIISLLNFQAGAGQAFRKVSNY